MDDAGVFDLLDLGEYERAALSELLALGRTTAPNLAEATGVPKARIYGVLESLADRGFVKVIPGRPKEYQPRSPEAILDRAAENRRQAFEAFGPRFEAASEDIRPAEELFYVVDVGEPSERETRRLYHEAEERVNVLTKSFAYLDSVAPSLADALDRGVEVDVLLLHPEHLSAENCEVQAEVVERIDEEFPAVGYRFSEEKLPWRGTLIDPTMEYDTGRAILLVEEKDVPLSMRQAAITENGSFVAGLKRYFDLVWEHDSVESYPE